MSELKPCPFCGGKPKMYTTASRQSYRRAVVKCQTCFAEIHCEGGGFNDFPDADEFEKPRLSNEIAKERAIELWNRRAERHAEKVIVANGATGHCKCGACGGLIGAWDNYCRHCGARLEVER